MLSAIDCDVISSTKTQWVRHGDDVKRSSFLLPLMDLLCHVRNRITYLLSWRTVSALLQCYFGVYFPSCEATREINTKITLSWVLKQFVTRVNTLISMNMFSWPQCVSVKKGEHVYVSFVLIYLFIYACTQKLLCNRVVIILIYTVAIVTTQPLSGPYSNRCIYRNVASSKIISHIKSRTIHNLQR